MSNDSEIKCLNGKTVFKSKKYSLSCERVSNNFQKFREHGSLCDVELVSGSTVVKAHRVVLAAASVYFETMFNSGLEECEKNSISLPSIPPEVLPLVVVFIYTGQTEISNNTVQHLIDAADMLRLDELSAGCAEYLKTQLHPSNVLGIIRMLYCSGTTSKDLYVIHHEMGHIQYYMAYENQPGIFRQGANSAFQESIGDAIMYGVMTSQHLHRIGLINDTILFHGNDTIIKVPIDDRADNEVEEEAEDINMTYNDIFLLKQALNKIPNIPFSLLVDEYRWKLFEGNIKEEEMNKQFWKMASELQGIAPPCGKRSETYFDAGAKFHVPDNTPYIRYFLSSFLQVQLFESLCKATVFGRRTDDRLPNSILLSQCDIYGSKTAGKILKEVMSKGSSLHWKESLRSATGKDVISASSLERYYAPLYKLLTKLTRAHRIPIGW